ncbi:unnamed protein product [Cuscuta campestris]|uniref:Uncharacterized protein n=1 Tax=Cuscuta campestris TaxID=132261 RepID=A0A484N3K4_9ASTE|nr:unnamed protein product [Cuscuta campestris]
MSSTTHIESLWVFALLSQAKCLSSPNLICFSLLLLLATLAMSVFYWAHPGGPAWGRRLKWRTTRFSPIPGPHGVPVFGSMTLMVGLAHHKLAAMAEACGAKRLMAFSLGETRAVVTCNPEVAREILNSSSFADRPVKESAYRLMFDRAIGFAPYGVYWRTLRKIAATHLFCPKQIRAAESQRSEITRQMIAELSSGPPGDRGVRVRDVLKRASLNNMMSSVFGRDYSLSGCPEMTELRELVDEGYELLGTFNWSDHLPCLLDLDPQRVRARCSGLVPRVNRFVGGIIADHRATPESEKMAHRDFVDVLLSLQGSEKLADSDMIAVLWEMIFRGTDTVAVLIEWILARIVLHPEVQSAVHGEIDGITGGGAAAVTESDVSKMVYLPAVIKEVLRLHPPGPLLSWARLAITDTEIGGYHVPAGTTAMVNMWAISRDPEVWEDPLEFRPERFLGGGTPMDFSVMGSDMRLAPFGSGRRTCPGKNLALTTVSFWVAALLREFEFTAAGNVDLTEVLKLSCEMVNPLTVNVRSRRSSRNLRV